MKLKYPTDRVIFFSDAVFAIAMTLLILEVKLPTVDEFQTIGIEGVLRKRIPNFVGYVISFLVTALFWKAHVQLCTLVKQVTNRFFWYNIWLLFFVVLMPFSTALYSNYFGDGAAFAFYWLNLGVIGLFISLLTFHIAGMPEVKEQFSAHELRWFRIRSMISPLVFISSIAIGLLSPWAGRWSFLLVFVIQMIGDRRARQQRLAK